MSESLVSSRICLRQPATAARACSRRGSKSRGRWSFGSGNWSPLTFWRATTGQLSTGFSLLQGTTSNTNRRPPRAASGPAQHRRLGRSAAWLQLPARRKWAFGANQRLPERPNAPQMQPNATPVGSTIGTPASPVRHQSPLVWVGGPQPATFSFQLPCSAHASCYQQLTLPPRRHEDCILCSRQHPYLAFCTSVFCTGTYTGILFVHDNQ